MSAPDTCNGTRRRRNESNRIKQATEAAQRSQQKTPGAAAVSPVEVQRLKALVQAQMAVRERVQSGCYDQQRSGDTYGKSKEDDPLMSDMVKACSALMKAMPGTQGSSPVAKQQVQQVQQAKRTMDPRKRLGSGTSPQLGRGSLQVDAAVFVPRPQYADGDMESSTSTFSPPPFTPPQRTPPGVMLSECTPKSATSTFSPLPCTPQRTPPGFMPSERTLTPAAESTSTFSPLPFTPQRTAPAVMLSEFTLPPAAESGEALLMCPPGLEKLSDAQIGLRKAIADLSSLSALSSITQSSGTQASTDSPSVSRNAIPRRVSMESLQTLTRAGGGKQVGQSQADWFMQSCNPGSSEKEQRVLAKLMNHVKSERNACSSCMFLCRGLHDLGLDSQNTLIDHFSKYGVVQGVYVAHTKGVVAGESFKSVIPGDLGIVVMKAAGPVMRIFGDGHKQYVKGLTVTVQPIVAEPSSPASSVGHGKCPPISENSTASASGSGSAANGSTSEGSWTD